MEVSHGINGWVVKRYPLKAFDYTKASRLRNRSEFIHTSTFGRKVQNRYFIACFAPNQRSEARLGITTTKRIGRAVIRNRIKRRTREYFRKNQKNILKGLDINVIAKKEAAALASEELFISIDDLFHKVKEAL